MGQKKSITLLALFFLVAAIAGCAGGSSNGTPASAAGAGTTPGITGGSGNSGSGTASAGQGAALAWDAPTTNADGTPLTDLAGYRVYYGTASGSYDQKLDVGMVTSYSLTGLAPGTYYISVTAYNSGGNESGFSNEVIKTVL